MNPAGTDNVEDYIYDCLTFLTPTAVLSNDGTAQQPQSWLSSYMSRAGGPICLNTSVGKSNSSGTLNWTLDGSAHQYAWSSVCVSGLKGNTQIYDITFDNTTDANSACDASVFNFDAYNAGDVCTINTGTTFNGHPSAEVTMTTSGNPNPPNIAREWFNVPQIYTSVWVMFSAFPPTNAQNFIWQATYSDNGDIEININPNGTMLFRVNYSTQLTTTFAASLNKWFKVSLFHRVSGLSSIYEFKINDGQEVHTNTSYTADTTNINLVQWGLDNNDANCHVFFAQAKADVSRYPYDGPYQEDTKGPYTRPAPFKPMR
jgi:hypothetical protein